MPEKADERSQAFKAGFKNIVEITKERIRRVVKNISKDSTKFEGDLGFKVFKLDSSNFKNWDPNFETLEEDLFDAVENIKKERSQEDILYEILLKYGLDLGVPIELRTVNEKKIYSISLGALIICLEENINIDLIKEICEIKKNLNPEIMRLVFSDKGFSDDATKTNAINFLSLSIISSFIPSIGYFDAISRTSCFKLTFSLSFSST